MADETFNARQADEDPEIMRLKNELTDKNLELLETRTQAMSSVAQLRTEVARLNAMLATANSEVRQLQSTQMKPIEYSAPVLEVQTIVPAEEEVRQLRSRVRKALRMISTLREQVQSYEANAQRFADAERINIAQLNVATSKIEQLERRLKQSEQKENDLASSMLSRINHVESEGSRLRELAVTRSKEVSEMEERLTVTLKVLQQTRDENKRLSNIASTANNQLESLAKFESSFQKAKEKIVLYEQKLNHQAKRIKAAVELRGALTECKSELDAEKLRNRNMGEQLEIAQAQVTELQKKSVSLRVRLDQSSLGSNSAQEELQQVYEKLGTMTAMFHAEKNEAETANQRIKQLENDLNIVVNGGLYSRDGTTDGGEARSSSESKLLLQVSSLEKQALERRVEYEKLQNRYSQLQSENRRLVQEREAVRQQSNEVDSKTNAKREKLSDAKRAQNAKWTVDPLDTMISTLQLYEAFDRLSKKVMTQEALEAEDMLEDEESFILRSKRVQQHTFSSALQQLSRANQKMRMLYDNVVRKYAEASEVCITQ